MTGTLLYASQQSSFINDILLWILFLIMLVVSVVAIFWQRRESKILKSELDILGKMRKNNVEFEFVLKSMRLSTWHIDASMGQIIFDNDFRGKNDTYAPAAGTVGDLTEILNEQDRQKMKQIVTDLFAGRIEEGYMEYQVQQPHKKPYWSESYAIVTERDVDGKPTRIVGTSARIDERKAMEKALIEARNRAEESDRLKSAFIANMSHEIRTPLNAIVGFTSILPDVQDAQERQTLLDLIHENTQKLLRIVDDVVNISKVEAGKEELVLTAFDLPITLNELADQYRPNLKPGVQMELAFASTSQIIMTDHNRFLEIMKHLLSNATKFTNQGTVTIGFDPPMESRIRIFVHDTGIGIAQEHQERIFERFFKVDEFVPGAGLGLSICRTMAYSLGGSIGVESQPGTGSLFWFEIPIQ